MPFKDPEKRKAYNKTYGKQWIKNLSPEHRTRRRKYNNDSKKKWYAGLSGDDKKKITEYKRFKYATDPTTRLRRFLEPKTRYAKMKQQVYDKLGDRCSSLGCLWINLDGSRGCTDRRCLQIDHIAGKGTKETKGMSTYAFLKKVINDETGMYQILCANCNWIKRHEKKEESPGRPIRPLPVAPAEPSYS